MLERPGRPVTECAWVFVRMPERTIDCPSFSVMFVVSLLVLRPGS